MMTAEDEIFLKAESGDRDIPSRAIPTCPTVKEIESDPKPKKEVNEYSGFDPDDEMIALRFGKISNVEDIKGKLLDDPLVLSWAASTTRLSPTP